MLVEERSEDLPLMQLYRVAPHTPFAAQYAVEQAPLPSDQTPAPEPSVHDGVHEHRGQVLPLSTLQYVNARLPGLFDTLQVKVAEPEGIVDSVFHTAILFPTTSDVTVAVHSPPPGY